METSVKEKTNTSERYVFTHMKYLYSTLARGDTFLVWWEGDPTPTREFREPFIHSLREEDQVEMGRFMEQLKSTGTRKKTLVGGDFSRAKRQRAEHNQVYKASSPLYVTNPPPQRESMVPVKFTSPNNSCIPFSYLNLVDSSNTKRHKVD